MTSGQVDVSSQGTAGEAHHNVQQVKRYVSCFVG